MTDGPKLSVLDRPNSYIGRSVPRPNARRLLQGRGRYVDDMRLPRLAHAAFLRSPYAHAEIVRIDAAAAKAAPGVFAVATGEEMAKVCTPWVGVLSHLQGLKSAPQHALAVGKAAWQGEPVVAVVAASRAEAEDAVELIDVEWRERPAVADMETALDPSTPVIHPDLGDNLAWRRDFAAGDVDAAFAAPGVTVVEEVFDSIREINERGTSVLLAEQNAHAALKVAGRGYVIEEGSVVLEGTREALMDNPDVRRAYIGV